MKRWRWIASFVVIGVITLSLCLPSFVRYYVAAKVVASLEEVFKGEFQATHSNLASGNLSWTGCSIESPTTHVSVSAKEIQYRYDWGLFNRNVRGELIIDGAQFDLDHLGTGGSFSEIRSAIASFDQRVLINSAELRRGEHRLVVEGQFFGDSGVTGELKIRPVNQEGLLIVRMDRIGGGGDAECVVESLGLSELLGVLNSGSRFDVKEGIVKGRFVMTLPNSGAPYVEGSLQLSDAHILDSQLGLLAQMPNVECVISEIRAENLIDGALAPLFEVKLLETSRLTFLENGEPKWQADELTGGAQVFIDGTASVELDGICLHGKDRAALAVRGKASLVGRGFPYADLSVELSAEDRPAVDIRLLARQDRSSHRLWEFQCKNLSRPEFEVLRDSVGFLIPDLSRMHFNNGTFDGSVILEVQNGTLASVRLEGVKGTFFDLSVPDCDFQISGDYGGGDFSANVTGGDPLRSLQADWTLINGTISLSLPDGRPIQLNDLKSRLHIEQGVLQKAIVNGNFSGLEGSIEIDWEDDQRALAFDFKGSLEHLAAWLPERVGQKVARVGKTDVSHIVGQVSRLDGELKVEGTIDVDSNLRKDRFQYGATIDLASPTVWGIDDIHSQQAATEAAELRLVVQALCPSFLAPSVELLKQSLDRSYGYHGIVLREGWVRGEQVPVARFVQPFIFDDDEQQLSGSCQFEAKFCNHEWVYRYSGKNLSLDSSLVKLELDRAGGMEDRVHGIAYPGYQYFNIRDDWEFGFLPVQSARLLDKTSGLQFDSIDALVVFGEKRCHALDLTSYVNGVYIAAQVDVFGKREEKKWLDVLARTHKISGDIPQVQQLLQAVDPSFTSLIPLDGAVTSGFHEGRLYVKRRRDGVTVEARVDGRITDGHASSDNGLVTVQGLGSGFSYDLERNLLTFEGLSGEVLVGSSDGADQYNISCRYARLRDFPHCQVEFDVHLEDATRDVVRLEGKGKVEGMEGVGDVVRLTLFNETSHIGVIRPNITELIVLNWERVFALRAHPELNLAYVSDDLKRLSKTGWIGLSPAEAQGLQELNLGGELIGDVFFDRQDKMFRFSLKGDKVQAADQAFDRCVISGSKKDNRWVVDQWELDELMLSCDALKTDMGWKIDFLGARYGTSLTLGCEGDYVAGHREFSGKINLLDLNFEGSPPLPLWLISNETWGLMGKVRSTGSVNGSFPGSHQENRFQVTLDAVTDSLKVGSFSIADAQPIHCYFDSSSGITVSGFRALLGGEQGLECSVERLRYEPLTEKLSLQDVQFSIASDELDDVTVLLIEQFKSYMDTKLGSQLQSLKDKGHLQGHLDIEVSPRDHQLRLHLADDLYLFGGGRHHLQDFILDYQKYGSKAKGVYRWQDENLPFEVSFDSDEWNSGTLLIGDRLKIQWVKQGEKGLLIQRMEGDFLGLDVDLTLADQDLETGTYALTGQVAIDARRARGLFPESIRRFFTEWDVGPGWLLSGRFLMKASDLSDISYVGALSGNDFQFKGFTFEHLFGDLSFGPDYVVLTDVKGLDRAGEGRIDSLELRKDPNGEWGIRVPLILVTDLEVGQLRSENGQPFAGKSLLIERVELRDVVGNPSSRASFTGSGVLHFVNPSRISHSNTLLSIPKDLLARIGLSPDVLAPVRGSLYGEFRDGHILINEFRDVFSEGRISRFYLPSDYEALVSFDGDLDLQVRMKQYNLIFKLAELFTITIKGDLANPTYTVQKQSDDTERSDGV